MNKIIYVGNFIPPWSTENHIVKSFEDLGWGVKQIQEDKLIESEVIAEAKKGYRFLLYTRTWFDTAEKWKRILNTIKIPTVSVHLDLYLGLERGNEIKNDTFFHNDYVFSADGGHQKQFEKLGFNHYFLSPGVFGRECYLGEKRDELKGDIIFVGSYRYHSEWNYRPALINWLRVTYKERFKLWGKDRRIWGSQLNNLYASVKIVVGDSLYSPNYWSDRIPETLGRGGFLIHPRVPGLEKQYKYYKHFIPYTIGDFEQLKEIIDYYLEHEAEREKIRLAGHNWVKANHTYKHKVKQIISILKQIYDK